MYTYGAGSKGTYGTLGQDANLDLSIDLLKPPPGMAYDESGNLISLHTPLTPVEKIDASIEKTAATNVTTTAMPSPAAQGGVTQLAPAGATVTLDPRAVPADVVNAGPAAVQAYRAGKGSVTLASSILSVIGLYRLIRRRKGGWTYFLGGTGLYFLGAPAGRLASKTA